jgi:hypothetical protein
LKRRALEDDDRLKYFLPPLRDDNNKTSKVFPIVLSKDALLTAKGVVPRFPNKQNTNW